MRRSPFFPERLVFAALLLMLGVMGGYIVRPSSTSPKPAAPLPATQIAAAPRKAPDAGAPGFVLRSAHYTLTAEVHAGP